MRTVRQVIAEAIVYDHLPGSGADRIIEALAREGYRIALVPSGSLPTETIRTYTEAT